MILTHENVLYTDNQRRPTLWSNVVGEIIPFNFSEMTPLTERDNIDDHVPGDLVKTTWDQQAVTVVPVGIVIANWRVNEKPRVGSEYVISHMIVVWSVDPRSVLLYKK